MRVIVKPAGLAVLGLVALAGIAIPTLRGKLTARGFGGGSGANISVDERWKIGLEHGGQGSLDRFSADGVPAVRITTSRVADSPWNVSLTQPLKAELRDGDILRFSFKARASSPRNIPVLFQKNTPGFPDFWKANFMVGTSWQNFSYEIKATTCKEWEPMVAFHLGETNGTFEITNVSIVRK